jgi:hypothetical protein
MQISLRLRLDREKDCAVAELEPGTVADRVPLGSLTPGGDPVTLDLDAKGYVVSITVPGLAAIIAAAQASNKGGKA